jgi:hypothetical protein
MMVVESQKVCIALLFVGIDIEHRVGLGGNLGGLGLKETFLFVSTSTEIYATFVVSRISGTNRVSPCASCYLFSAAYLCSSCS